MKVFKILVFLFSLFFNVYVFADNVNIESSVSRTTVALNEALNLVVSVSNDSKNLPEFSLPTLKDFNVYSTSRSQSTSIMNGQVKSSINYTYTIGPKNVGEFTIPSFKLNYNGNTYETQPITITVEQAKTRSSVSVQNTQRVQQKQSSQVYDFDTSKAIFVESKTDKKQVYVNEKVIYTFSFYTSVNLLSNPSYQAPNFLGFFVGKTSQNNYMTQINGKNYSVTEVSTELFPQNDGTLTIDSSQLSVAIQDFSKVHDEFFSSFFTRSKNETLVTDPIKIKVLKAPGNVGMIGSFSMSATVDNKAKKEDEPFDLKITIKGDGNIKTISEPQLILSENLKKYETSEKIITSGEQEVGKEFTTLIMPLSKGPAEIRVVPISYFDTKTKQVKKLTVKNILLNISENKDKQQQILQTQQIPLTDTNSVTNINQNSTVPQNVDFSWIFKVYNYVISLQFWLIVGSLILLYIIVRLVLKYIDYINKDQQKLKNKKAYKKSKKYFQKAKKTKSAKEFYEYMYKGMLEYFASVLAKSADGLTAYKIRKDLEEKNINKELIEQIENVLEECTVVLYANASQSNTENFKDFYNKAFDILKKLDL